MEKTNKTSKRKKQWGDRKDGYLLRDLDPLHLIMPYMYPNRCDNEAFIQETIDLTAINKFLNEKNKTNPEYPYKLFQIVVASIVKIMTLRPKMNRFIQGQKMYMRNDISVSFIIKKQFADSGKEAIAFIEFDEDSTLETVRDKMYNEITKGKGEDYVGGADNSLNIVSKIPRFVLGWVVKFLNWLDFHGKVPTSLCTGDPSYASVFVTNLGSIKLNAGYHHLTQRGTNSVFVVLGETHKKPFYDDKGNVTMKEVLEVGLTLDERIADGYYYSKTIKLLNHLLQNPQLLELPANEEVDYDTK